jgi:hypothetical protein
VGPFEERLRSGEDRESDAALEAWDEVLAPDDEARDLGETGPVVYSLLYKAALLDRLGRAEEAIDAYDQIQSSYNATGDAKIRPYIESALARREFLRSRT